MAEVNNQFDTAIVGARYFDGTGGPSSVQNIGIRHGKIVHVSQEPIHRDNANVFIEASGQWVTPGFIDLHTHYDAEMILAPGLVESVRHGVTTCFVGSCSISLIHSEPEDASDIFTRVESIPREYVLPALQKLKTWNDSAGYVDFLRKQPLGPNIASYLGHSDLRVAVMGLGRAVDPKVVPSEQELQQMERFIEQAIDNGLLGLSGMTNPWDKVDGDRFRSKALPSVYARWKELRRLHRVLRRRGAILQSAPNLNNPINAVFFMLTSARLLFRSTLKTTLITLMDIKARPGLDRLMAFAANTFNTFMGANFRWQCLPQPFKVYADGMDFIIFEEFPAGEALLHLTENVDRNKLISDPVYRKQFKKEYKRKVGGRVWHRDFSDANVINCPDTSLIGKSIAQIAQDRGEHEVDTFLDLIVEYGQKLRWSTCIGNHNTERRLKNIADDNALIGFSDAGAHLRNMAFYNFGLCVLQDSLVDDATLSPERAVHRISGEIADWYGINAGHLNVGDRADLVILDPEALKTVDLSAYAEAPIETMGGLRRVVNRNDGVISTVIINGNIAVESDVPCEDLGSAHRYGSFLSRNELTGSNP